MIRANVLLTLAVFVTACAGAQPEDPCPPERSWIPAVSLGADLSVAKYDTVTLRAVTANADGGRLEYSWTARAPDGEEQVRGFGPESFDLFCNQKGTFEVSVTVKNYCMAGSDVVQVTCLTRPPVASVRSDKPTPNRLQTVYLFGEMEDPDGDSLRAEQWSFVEKPAGSAATISEGKPAHFKPDLPGNYVIGYVASDRDEDSALATTTVTALNQAPVANAWVDRDATLGAPVSVTQRESSDPDGDLLTFSWTMTLRPAGSDATLETAIGETATFTPDVAGVYELGLTAHDGYEPSALDRVRIEVHRPVLSLSHKVIDAAYSPALDRIVSVGTSPHALYLFDPIGGTLDSVALAHAPNSVAVSPDGRFAAVGHDGFVSHVDLVNKVLVTPPGAVANPYPIPLDAGDVVLTATHVYLSPKPADTRGAYFGVVLDSGVIQQSTGTTYGASLALHPGGAAIYGAEFYGALRKFTFEADGTPVVGSKWEYLNDHGTGGKLWLYDDGTRAIGASGEVFALSATPEEDMKYLGGLEGDGGATPDLAYSASVRTDRNEIATLSDGVLYRAYWGRQVLRTFLADDLVLTSSTLLPRWISGTDAPYTVGKFVFHNAAGDKKFVVVEAANLPSDGVVVY